MACYVVLLRGVNVGGRNRLPMSSLRGALKHLGCTDVKTYVQSGNAVITASALTRSGLADALGLEIDRRCGFRPGVAVLTRAALAKAMAANPYPESTDQPTLLHLFFLDRAPEPEAQSRLEALRAETESVQLQDRVLYLLAPDGIGRSRLVKGIDRATGCAATGRNWRTISSLADLADAAAER